MADTTFRTVLPDLKAVDNGDGTYSVAVSMTNIGFPGTEVYNASPAAAWTWYDIDCSAVVGARRALMLCKVVIDAGGAGGIFLREDGEATTHTAAGGADFISLNASEHGYGMCFTSAAGGIELLTTAAARTYVVTIEAYVGA